MARLDTAASASDVRKEATQRRVATKNKTPSTSGTWPCTMNGCNKHFAREADLKRHQRTTKSHSNPGFACPQCDAAFTRMDALRRHQRSRHNGVVIDMLEPTSSQERLEPPSESRSSSATPSLKGKERADVTYEGPAYYRPYQSSTNPSTTRLPPIFTTPPIGLPTSATRFGESASLGYHSIHGHDQSYYSTSQYRLRPSESATRREHDRSDSISSSDTSRPPTPPAEGYANGPNGTDKFSRAPPVIDPSLESQNEVSSSTQAYRVPYRGRDSRSPSREDHIKGRKCAYKRQEESDSSDESDVEEPPSSSKYLRRKMSSERVAMENIYTEDGQPMLNPAELLTQESLASP
ncbi:C2H2-type domain-containing protein [Pleurotus pulmonarius]|nr:hypothetical protein EYR36_008026 [Pleurotus pulmonarius]